MKATDVGIKFFKKPWLMLLIVVSFNLFAQKSEYISHQVRPNDQIGRILYDSGSKRIWGKGGDLEKVFKLNPFLIKSSGNHLKVGQIIVLPVFQNAELEKTANSPARDLASVENNSEIADWPYSQIKFNFGVEYMRFDMTDFFSNVEVRFLSELMFTYDLSWTLFWNEENSTRFKIINKKLKIIEPINRNFESVEKSLLGFELLWKYQTSEKFRIGIGVAMTPNIDVLTRTNNDLYFQSLLIPEAYLNPEILIINKANFDVKLGLIGGLTMPVKNLDNKIERGYFYSSHLGLEHLYKGILIEASLYYEFKKFDSSFNKQKNHSAGLSLGLGYEFK